MPIATTTNPIISGASVCSGGELNSSVMAKMNGSSKPVPIGFGPEILPAEGPEKLEMS
jgi:hypothetical protein